MMPHYTPHYTPRHTPHFTRYAFFDLDGTLISEASVISFYHYYVERKFPRQAAQLSAQFRATLVEMIHSGVGREDMNAWFYKTHFHDVEVSHIRSWANAWLATRCPDPRFFKEPVLEAMQRCRAQGIGTVVITGSFREVVAPLVERFQADAYLCAPLEEVAGRYTGILTAHPMIGQGKALAITQFLAEHEIAAQDCYGYGDDHTDIDFLALLGKPTVLTSGTGQFLAHAKMQGWDTIEA